MRKPIPFTEVKFNDKFWLPRIKTNEDVTIDICIKRCEETGRIDNFSKAAGLMEGSHIGRFYNDSDVYKVIEGIAYTLATTKNETLEKRADEIIKLIAQAQRADGYINTYFQLERPNDIWTDMNLHEMYCGGHMIEAAIAYKNSTGKTELFDVAIAFADHLCATFGVGKRHWVPGHQEIELALVKLAIELEEMENRNEENDKKYLSGNRIQNYLEMAMFLLGERGHGHGIKEGSASKWNAEYYQDTAPVEEMEDVTGHAVRATYMYAAMADLIRLKSQTKYEKALLRIWRSIVHRNFYVIGGIGSSKHNEGFTEDYDLPNDTAYCETCAAVGMALWNARMNYLYGDAKYMDIAERSMYNNVLSGVSLDADTFFYVNPLYSDGNHHRQKWYDCSCCPTQISRFIPSVGNYVYSIDEDNLYVNLFAQSKAEFEGYKVIQETNYPWDGTVKIRFEKTPANTRKLNIRMPQWCSSVKINEKYNLQKGYLVIDKQINSGDTIELTFEMEVKRVHADDLVTKDVGLVCLQRGPIVYCIEKVDCNIPFEDIVIEDISKFAVRYEPEMLNGIVCIDIFTRDNLVATAVPYAVWDNREPGEMAVWLKERITDSGLYKF